jgi:hypothetical protein
MYRSRISFPASYWSCLLLCPERSKLILINPFYPCPYIVFLGLRSDLNVIEIKVQPLSTKFRDESVKKKTFRTHLPGIAQHLPKPRYLISLEIYKNLV